MLAWPSPQQTPPLGVQFPHQKPCRALGGIPRTCVATSAEMCGLSLPRCLLVQGVLKSPGALFAFTPLYLALDGLSQHMRATLKFLQQTIDASERSDFQPHQDIF
jgi:hypothetical protein